MKKKEFIINIILLVALIYYLVGNILSAGMSFGDELINFSNVFKMSNGFQIYKDIAALQNPLFFYIGKIFLDFFGKNYLGFRIYNVFMYLIFFYLIYKLLSNLKVKKPYITIYMCIFILIFSDIIISFGVNYNILSLILTFIGILICLEKKYNNKNFIVLQGLLMFLVFMAKQNIGVFYIVSISIIQMIQQEEKLTTKNRVQNICKEILIYFGLYLIYLVYLSFSGGLYNYIDYTFLGIFNFGKNNSLFDWRNYLIINIISIVALCIFIKVKGNLIKDKKENIKILLPFSITYLLASYPIVDDYHTIIGMCITAIMIIYIFHDLYEDKYLKKGLCIFVCVTIIFVSVISTTRYIKTWLNTKINDKNSPYYGLVKDEIIEKKFNNVLNYIKEQKNKVIILSYDSLLYNDYLRVNNGIFDILLHGNIGMNEDAKVEKALNELDNGTIILLRKEYYDVSIQELKSYKQYIRDNYLKIDNIEEYDVYEKQ